MENTRCDRFRVASISRAVVKSTACQLVQSVNVVPYGMQHNRTHILLGPDWAKGNFLRMISPGCHKLAHVVHEIAGDTAVLTVRGVNQSQQSRLVVSLLPEDDEPVDVIMWNKVHMGVVIPHGSEWFSKYLGIPVRLVQLSPKFPRVLYSQELGGEYQTSYVDNRPFHFLTRATIQRLERVGEAPLSDLRFRGIVLEGADEGAAFAEDYWNTISVNGIVMRQAGPKPRCGITCIEPETGEKGPQPLAAAVKIGRRGSSDILFGVDFVHDVPAGLKDPWEVFGTVSVGDEVKVLDFFEC